MCDDVRIKTLGPFLKKMFLFCELYPNSNFPFFRKMGNRLWLVSCCIPLDSKGSFCNSEFWLHWTALVLVGLLKSIWGPIKSPETLCRKKKFQNRVFLTRPPCNMGDALVKCWIPLKIAWWCEDKNLGFQW